MLSNMYVYVYIYECVYICIYVCIYLYAFAYTHTHICTHTRTHTHMYTNTYTYTNTHTHTYIHTHTDRFISYFSQLIANSAALFLQPFLKMVEIYVCNLVEKIARSISNWNRVGYRSGWNTSHLISVGIPAMC